VRIFRRWLNLDDEVSDAEFCEIYYDEVSDAEFCGEVIQALFCPFVAPLMGFDEFQLNGEQVDEAILLHGRDFIIETPQAQPLWQRFLLSRFMPAPPAESTPAAAAAVAPAPTCAADPEPTTRQQPPPAAAGAEALPEPTPVSLRDQLTAVNAEIALLENLLETRRTEYLLNRLTVLQCDRSVLLGERCSICFEDNVQVSGDLATTQCGHQFHLSCLRTSWNTRRVACSFMPGFDETQRMRNWANRPMCRTPFGYS
jgi:hypothetical protein